MMDLRISEVIQESIHNDDAPGHAGERYQIKFTVRRAKAATTDEGEIRKQEILGQTRGRDYSEIEVCEKCGSR
jgi:hypothetical protein